MSQSSSDVEPVTRTESPLASSKPDPGAADPTTAEPTGPTMFDRVATVIEVIRPAIQADEGDIVLHEVDEATGVVTVELLGACVTCPISTGTLKDGVERILRKRVDGVTAVRHIGEPLEGAETGTAVSL
jgi:Fe-S cluster biogenesis protein NfuA